MKTFVTGSEPFKALSDKFEVAATQSGYQVAYSPEKNGTYTVDTDAVVPAGEVLVYIGAQRWGYYMLSGCTDENVVILL